MTCSKTNKTIKTSLCALALWMGCQPMTPAVNVQEQAISKKVYTHVSEALEKHFGKKLNPEEVTIQIIKVPGGPFPFPNVEDAKDIQIETESTLERMYSNRAIVRVQMIGPNGEKRFAGVPVRIALMKPVWVVENAVPAGKSLSPKDFRVIKREISQNVFTTVAADKELAGYEARVNLHPGEILDSRKIYSPPEVRRNADVRILLTSSSGLQVVVQGQALSDGHIGDTIRVKQRLNLSQSKTKYYSAKVINKNQVQVEI